MFSNIKHGCLRGIQWVPLFYARKKPHRINNRDGVFTQQSKCRESKERVIVFVFFSLFSVGRP